jgi:hypothetical protein
MTSKKVYTNGLTPTMVLARDAALLREDHRLPDATPPATLAGLRKRGYITPARGGGNALTVAGVLLLDA